MGDERVEHHGPLAGQDRDRRILEERARAHSDELRRRVCRVTRIRSTSKLVRDCRASVRNERVPIRRERRRDEAHDDRNTPNTRPLRLCRLAPDACDNEPRQNLEVDQMVLVGAEIAHHDDHDRNLAQQSQFVRTDLTACE